MLASQPDIKSARKSRKLNESLFQDAIEEEYKGDLILTPGKEQPIEMEFHSDDSDEFKDALEEI